MNLNLFTNSFSYRLYVGIIRNLVTRKIYRFVDDFVLVLYWQVYWVFIDELVLGFHELRLGFLEYIHDCGLSNDSLFNRCRNVFGDIFRICAHTFSKHFRWGCDTLCNVTGLLIKLLYLTFVIGR